jgi:hypothetical protein
MISPASWRPDATAPMIWSKGMTLYRKPSGSTSRRVRKAVVSVPGTAMRATFSSSIVMGRRATTIGP